MQSAVQPTSPNRASGARTRQKAHGTGAERSALQIGVFWVAVATTLVVLSPWAATLAAAVPACIWKTITGIPCPACGTTRAALHLADLDFATAFVSYPLASVGWTLVIVGGLLAGLGAAIGRGVPQMGTALHRNRVMMPLRILVLAAVLGNWWWLITTGA